MPDEELGKEELLKKVAEQQRQLDDIRTSFMNSPVGIYMIQDWRFCWSNTKFREITGYTGEELESMPPEAIVFPEDREHVRQAAIRMLKGQRKEPYHFRSIDKSGGTHWITETVNSITHNGKRAVLGMFLDITESEQIRSAFTHSPIGIYILQNRKFVFSNEKFLAITGYSQEELFQKHPSEIVWPQDREIVRENAIKMMRGELKEPYRFRVIDKSNRILWIMETVSSIRYRGERAVLSNFMDITRVKMTEEALKESENKYRSLFELAREGIVIINYDDGSILDSNREFLYQTGYGMDYLKGRKIWEIQPNEFQAEARKSFERFRESFGGIVSWKLCQGKKGKILPVEIVAARMTMRGREVIFCMVRDISERESMMRALSISSEEWRNTFDSLEDAVLLINPDYTVHRANLGAARLLNMDVRRIVGEKCYEILHGTKSPPDYCPRGTAESKGVYCEAEKEEPNVGRILRFSSSPIKDELGKVTRMVEVISDVTNRRREEKESARLSRALAASFQGITESLSDLAESRDPYTAGHSKHVAKLAVMAGKEMGLSEDDLQGLRISAILHDIGKAIIPAAILNKPGSLSEHEWGLIKAHPTTAYETLRHIPFPWPVADVVYQHHERLDGSGYPQGLKGNQIHMWARIITVADILDAITSHRPYRKSLPRQMALDELVMGRGTLYDPMAAEALIKVMYLEDKRILVVDSDDQLLKALTDELTADGLSTTGMSDPEQALEAFTQKPYPLVITELNMLKMDGVHLTRQIKAVNPHTEVIVITRYGGKEDTLRVLRAGASDFLEKPLDLEILRKSVNRALQCFAGKLA